MGKTIQDGRAKHWPSNIKIETRDIPLADLSRYPYFVRCEDTFMSGWGEAKDAISWYVLACETMDEVRTVTANARARGDMQNPLLITKLTPTAITAKPGDHVSVTTRRDASRWFEAGAFRDDA